MSLRDFFQGATLEIEDLYLLEAFQIGYLPGWAPERALAAVLWAYPSIKRFLLKKNPALEEFIEHAMEQHGPGADQQELDTCEDELLWTIADLLIYNKCPEFYDAMEFHDWGFCEVTDITRLEERVVIDGGAGTGRVTLAAASKARYVFAVEPVGRLRQFIREKAAAAGLSNVFVMDGFLHQIPLPDGFADVLITSHALGWCLEAELREFERVVKPGGYIVHCPGTAEVPSEEETHTRLISPDWGYAYARFQATAAWKRKYSKRLPDQ
jgi:ubiquinone/menaquinone biosynthesis C-methylase UbiE